jgi:hypothetical protein
MGATAFAERASQLERRIRAIGQRRGSASRRARLGAAAVGVVVVSAAWVAPRPPAPPRASHPTAPAPLAQPAAHDSSVAPAPVRAVPDLSPAPTKPAVSANAPTKQSQTSRDAGDSAHNAALAASLKKVTDSAAVAETLTRRQVPGPTVTRTVGPAQASPQEADSVFERLFNGIALTQDQAAKARELIDQLEAAQVAQMASTVRALLAAMPLRQAIQAHADSTLENLLTNESDKTLLYSRFIPQVPGGRGRSGGGGARARAVSGGLVGDSVFINGGGRGGRVGGGGRGAAPVVVGTTGMAGGGRVGGGGRGGAGNMMTEVEATDFVFHRYFDGIALTPQQEGDARTILTKMQADLRAVNPPVPATIIARPPFSNQVIMSPESAAAFAAILTNDADRATLQSRIRVEVVRTIEAPPR